MEGLSERLKAQNGVTLEDIALLRLAWEVNNKSLHEIEKAIEHILSVLPEKTKTKTKTKTPARNDNNALHYCAENPKNDYWTNAFKAKIIINSIDYEPDIMEIKRLCKRQAVIELHDCYTIADGKDEIRLSSDWITIEKALHSAFMRLGIIK